MNCCYIPSLLSPLIFSIYEIEVYTVLNLLFFIFWKRRLNDIYNNSMEAIWSFEHSREFFFEVFGIFAATSFQSFLVYDSEVLGLIKWNFLRF